MSSKDFSSGFPMTQSMASPSVHLRKSVSRVLQPHALRILALWRVRQRPIHLAGAPDTYRGEGVFILQADSRRIPDWPDEVAADLKEPHGRFNAHHRWLQPALMRDASPSPGRTPAPAPVTPVLDTLFSAYRNSTGDASATPCMAFSITEDSQADAASMVNAGSIARDPGLNSFTLALLA